MGDNPWDADLEQRFEDEDIRAQVSEFLGEQVQPYVTKLEQATSPDRDAQRLWESFSDTPVETSIQVTRELYGDEIADRFADILQGKEPTAGLSDTSTDGDTEPPAQPPASTDAEATQRKLAFEDLPPEAQEAIAQVQQEKSREQYYEELNRVTKEHSDDLPKDEKGDPIVDVDIFHPFVVAAEGDFDNAWKAYAAWQEKAREQFGIKVPDAPVEQPPPTIDSKTRDAGQTPPTEKVYNSWDEAMDDFFAEMKSPPPTVGTV